MDHLWDGNCFNTICTKNRKHFFGEIVDVKMILSNERKLEEKYCQEISKQFSYVTLDEFVIMPDRIHGILIIKHFDTESDAINRVSLKSNSGGICHINNPMLDNNVSRIIRWYKGRITIDPRKNNPNFAWQSLFYDHIFRNENALFYIRRYIKNNPKIWQIKRNKMIDKAK